MSDMSAYFIQHLLYVCVGSETKVVLNGNSTVQLTDLATKAGSLGLPNFSVQDAGKTQVRPPRLYTHFYSAFLIFAVLVVWSSHSRLTRVVPDRGPLNGCVCV